MQLNGLRIDEVAIGRGLYEIICAQGDQAVVAFGMIPKWCIDSLRPMLREKIISEAAKRIGHEANEVREYVNEATIADMMREIERQVILSIYSEAKAQHAVIV